MPGKDISTPRSRDRWVVAVWTALLVVAAGLVCAKGLVVMDAGRRQVADAAAKKLQAATTPQLLNQVLSMEGLSEEQVGQRAGPQTKIEPTRDAVEYGSHWEGRIPPSLLGRSFTIGVPGPGPYELIMRVSDSRTADLFFLAFFDDRLCQFRFERHNFVPKHTAWMDVAVMLDDVAVLVFPGCLGLYVLFLVRAGAAPNLRRTYAKLMLGVAFLAMLGWQVTDSEHATTLFNTDRRLLRVEIIVFLCMAIPALFLLLRKLKRTDVPECASCGYNLTGNQSGICPECGTRVPYALWRRRYPPPPEAELEPNPIRYSP